MRVKEPITVFDTIQSNTKGVTYGDPTDYSKTFQTDGVITRIRVDTNVGQQYDLRTTLELNRSEGQTENLLDPLGKNYLAGNGGVIDMEVRRGFQAEDTLHILMENHDTNGNDYTASVLLSVDYEGWSFGKLFRRLM